MDDIERLRPVYEALKEEFRCEFLPDIYTGEQWLEIMPKDASKAHAALKLKTLLGADRLVCFGDAKNDIPLFRAADECYATTNAADELKELATEIIGSNTEDGVAVWLSRNAAKYEKS